MTKLRLHKEKLPHTAVIYKNEVFATCILVLFGTGKDIKRNTFIMK